MPTHKSLRNKPPPPRPPRPTTATRKQTGSKTPRSTPSGKPNPKPKPVRPPPPTKRPTTKKPKPVNMLSAKEALKEVELGFVTKRGHEFVCLAKVGGKPYWLPEKSAKCRRAISRKSGRAAARRSSDKSKLYKRGRVSAAAHRALAYAIARALN
jgi:hypothetical protein